MPYTNQIGQRRSYWYSHSLGFDMRWLIAAAAMFAIGVLTGLIFAVAPL